MQNSMKIYLILILGIAIAIPAQGQGLLNRVLKRSKDKIEQGVEDMLVEKASDAISRKIYRSMSDAFDKMIYDAAKQDSAYQANYGDSVAIKYGQLADNWMARMNEAVDLPDSYAFDRTLLIETTSGKDVNEMKMYLSSGSPLLGIEQEEGSDIRLIVIDTEKDVTVLYMTDKKGKKTAQAIPNMMRFAGAMASSYQADSMDHMDYTFESTGKTRQVAGYTCQEYVGESEEYESTFYITEELDVDWKEVFGGMIERFAGSTYDNKALKTNGFMLESHSQHKKKKKDTSSWITKEVKKEGPTILNADYEFGGMSTS